MQSFGYLALINDESLIVTRNYAQIKIEIMQLLLVLSRAQNVYSYFNSEFRLDLNGET